MKLLITVVIVAAVVFAGASARAGDAENELRLSLAIDEALENNPEIRVLQNKLQSARARGNQSTYLEDPELNLETWGIPLNQPASIRSSNPIVFGLRQKVPFFGKRALKSEMAGNEVRMAE
jgi:outer membrane protein TolC